MARLLNVWIRVIIVHVSPAVLQELKRIIEDSEVMKYGSAFVVDWYHFTDAVCDGMDHIGKMTANGPPKTSLEVRSWKCDWAMSTSPLRQVLNGLQDYSVDGCIQAAMY